MFKLEQRKKARKHMAAVNAGEIKDPVVSHGTDKSGNVIGDDGAPVSGTAPGGYTSDDGDEEGEGGGNTSTNSIPDYSKVTTHAALNAELAKLGVETPEGWTDDKPTVAEKQAKLNELANGKDNGGGW